MNPKKSPWGHMDRWLIHKGAFGWCICAPGSYKADWVFPTGAEALAAFTKGDQHEN